MATCVPSLPVSLGGVSAEALPGSAEGMTISPPADPRGLTLSLGPVPSQRRARPSWGLDISATGVGAALAKHSSIVAIQGQRCHPGLTLAPKPSLSCPSLLATGPIPSGIKLLTSGLSGPRWSLTLALKTWAEGKCSDSVSFLIAQASVAKYRKKFQKKARKAIPVELLLGL